MNKYLSKQYAIIFDIDGTTSDTDHRAHFLEQSPKDWDAFYEAMKDDKPIKEVVDLAKALNAFNLRSYDKVSTIFITGRPEKYREITEKWLTEHLGHDNYVLFMRKNGNHEPDTKYKEKMFNVVGSLWHVLFAIDDRTRVVDHLNAIFGFPTIQFQKHDF